MKAPALKPAPALPPGQLVDQFNRPLRPAAFTGSRFEGARFNRLAMDWVVSTLTPNAPPWERETLQNRSRDRVLNDPIASSIPDTLCVNIVGPGLTPESRMRSERLGLSEEETEELQTQAEEAFARWQPWADAAGRLDFQEIQDLVMRKVIEDGEVLVNLPVLRDALRPLGRALEVISGDRLATPRGRQRTNKNIFQGVELGEERKEPLRYWIRKAPKTMVDIEVPQFEFAGIPARDSRGRPMILHIFATRQPGQVRGVPHFAPVLKYFKNMADSLDAEVVAQKVAACLSAVITRQHPDMTTFETTTDPDTGKKLVKLEPGMVPTLGIGEDLKLIDFKRGGETFKVFLTTVLRILGNAFGLPYELLLKDFSEVNYSSARAALLEGWRYFLYWRSWLTRKLCQPVWELVLEEAWLRGQFRVADFYANREEYCRAAWIGPGRGWVDPVKEVVSAKLEEDFGYATLADQCAAQGRNWEDVMKQRAKEQRRREQLGLPPATSKQVQIIFNENPAGGEEDAAE